MVADPVLGAQRTLRSQLIVAQTVNSLCQAIPGLPSVQAAGDGWVLRASTGAVQTCATVREVWTALIRKASDGGSVPVLLDAIRRSIPEAEGLTRSVLHAGLEAEEESRSPEA